MVRITRSSPRNRTTKSPSPTRSNKQASPSKSPSSATKPQRKTPSRINTSGIVSKAKKREFKGKGKDRRLSSTGDGDDEYSPSQDDDPFPIQMSGALQDPPRSWPEEAFERRSSIMEPQPLPRQSSLRSKRKASDELTDSASKRVRFWQGPPSDLVNHEPSRRYPPIGYREKNRMLVWGAIGSLADVQSLADVPTVIRAIQDRARRIADSHFGPNSGQRDVGETKINLAELKTRFPSQFLTIQSLLDASATNNGGPGWERFMTEPKLRQWLNYAIIGEWLTQRVFKDTEFGLPDDYRQHVHEEIDVKYLNYDGFVRGQLRGTKLAEFFESSENLSAAAISLYAAAENLTDQIMQACVGFHLSTASLEDEIRYFDSWHTVFRLVSDCAVLNWSFVLLGGNGTMIRIADRVENGLVLNKTSPFECVNQADLDEARWTDPEITADHRRVVKMTCWARVEALEACGNMNQAQMEEKQRQGLLNLAAERHPEVQDPEELETLVNQDDWDKFCWDCEQSSLENPTWKAVPESLRPEAIDLHSMKSFARNTILKHRRLSKQSKRADENDEVDSDMSEEEEAVPPPTDENGNITCAFVREYMVLTPHQVYCELTLPEEHYREILEAEGIKMTGRRVRDVHSLENAVNQAIQEHRRTLPLVDQLRLRTNDLGIDLWNFYARHNLKIEWGSFVFFAVMLGVQGGRAINHASRLVSTVNDILSTLRNKLLPACCPFKDAMYNVVTELYTHLEPFLPSMDDTEISITRIGQFIRGLPLALVRKCFDLFPKIDTRLMEENAVDLRDHIVFVFENLARKMKGLWPDIVDATVEETNEFVESVSTAITSSSTAVATSTGWWIGSMLQKVFPAEAAATTSTSSSSMVWATPFTSPTMPGPIPGSWSSTKSFGRKGSTLTGTTVGKKSSSANGQTVRKSGSGKTSAATQTRTIAKPTKTATKVETKTVTVTERGAGTGVKETVTETMTLAKDGQGAGWRKDLHRITLRGDRPATIVINRGRE